MILAVNVGNTNIRAAVGDKGFVLDAVFSVALPFASEDFIELIEQHLGKDIWEQIDGSILSSVVPEQNPVIIEAIKNKTGKSPQRIDVRMCGKLNMKHYDGLIGEDRVVCCACALQKYKPPFIVIDFGTATTINVVSENGEFLGGAILTGVQIGLSALSDNTAQLPRIEIDADVPIIGKNTKENLLSGAVIGASCAVEGFIRRIEAELGRTAPVIVTGGHASMILPYCNFKYIHEYDLLLNGLFSLYNNLYS